MSDDETRGQRIYEAVATGYLWFIGACVVFAAVLAVAANVSH